MHAEIAFTATLAVTSLKYPDTDPSERCAASRRGRGVDQGGEASGCPSLWPTADLQTSGFTSRFHPSHAENYRRDHPQRLQRLEELLMSPAYFRAL